jgi:ribosomal protein S18 acetylase RimI-like enzyme
MLTGMGEPALIRRAQHADIPALAGTLRRAFLDDPVACWAFQPDRLRASALERFQATRIRQLLGGDEVWTTQDLSCAALWAPAGSPHRPLSEAAELLGCFHHPLLLARLPLVAAGWRRTELAHPRKPHWYLAVLGTDPPAQGLGLGSAVLAPALEQCDRDGVGAYLESSKERNIDFYARHGFRVLRELKLTRGPTVWPMWREPRS